MCTKQTKTEYDSPKMVLELSDEMTEAVAEFFASPLVKEEINNSFIFE